MYIVKKDAKVKLPLHVLPKLTGSPENTTRRKKPIHANVNCHRSGLFMKLAKSTSTQPAVVKSWVESWV